MDTSPNDSGPGDCQPDDRGTGAGSGTGAGNRRDGQLSLMEELARLWVRAQPVVSAYVAANVADAHHADDLVQEVAQVVAQRFAEYDAARPFTPWVLGIARNRVLKYYRARSRDRLVLSEAALERLADSIAKTDVNAEDRREALRVCLDGVKGKQRQLIESRYREGHAVADIATRMGTSASSVSVMLFRARRALLECIQARLAAGEGPRA
jgi:RNA polymerase sigma-70 factor (ECF subfamily)